MKIIRNCDCRRFWASTTRMRKKPSIKATLPAQHIDGKEAGGTVRAGRGELVRAQWRGRGLRLEGEEGKGGRRRDGR